MTGINKKRKRQKGGESQTMVKNKINLCNEYLKVLSDNLENSEVIALLEIIHRFMSPLFSAYIYGDNLMGYEGFFEFYKDFGIFPEVISKIKLEGIFDALSYIYRQNPEKTRKMQGDVIDEHIFVESLILIASQLKFKFKKEPSIC